VYALLGWIELLLMVPKVTRSVAAVVILILLSAAPGLAIQKKTIRVGLPTASPPFSFFDLKLKNTRGFCVDLALMMGRSAGVKIVFYGFDDLELINALRTGKIDVVGCTFHKPLPESDFQLIDTGVRIDRHLFTNKACLTITCLKDLPTHRVVYSGQDVIQHPDFPGDSVFLIETASTQAALELLNSGGADVYVSPNSLSTTYQIQRLGLTNIKQVGLPFETVPLSLAVLKERVDLLSEVSLALGKIQENEYYQSLKNKWFGRDIKASRWEAYIKYILASAAGLALFVLLFAAWNVALKRKVNRVTENLVLSEQKYRELIESSPDMIHIISADGRLLMTNRRAKELFDKNASTGDEKKLSELVVADQQADMNYFIASLFENGYGEDEFIFLDAQGTRLPVEMVATTLQETGSEGHSAACFSRDLRVRKSLEEELIRSERLAIMGQMSASIAHEINNPLGIISSYAQDLLGGGLDEETCIESLNVIANNAERAGRIVSGLLSFSRHAEPVRAPVDIADLLEASLMFVKLEMKHKKVAVQKQYAKIPVIIYGDENQLVQVFVNLLINAIQAVAEKGQITISYQLPKPEERSAVIVIQDNGAGIKASDLEKLFQPFYSTKETGFGLGLFISSMIVERHKGRIQAESKEGEGTVMRVFLPLSLENAMISTRETNAT
jgi:PAS domain S-box-containing protein